MGMAYNAPDNYVRKYEILEHAIQRLRERLKDSSPYAHRPDKDLGNLIDEQVGRAIDGGAFESVNDRGEPTMIVDLSPAVNEDLWAVVRENKYKTKTGYKWVVMTLLTGEMVRRNQQEGGRWTEETEPPAPPPAPKLGDKYSEDLKRLASQVGNMSDQKREHASQRGGAVETRLVSYMTADGQGPFYEEYLKDEVAKYVEDLINSRRINSQTVRVWKEVKAKVIVEID